jgi:hypothetical protein
VGEVKVEIVSAAQVQVGTFAWEVTGRGYRLELVLGDGRRAEAFEADLFECLTTIRRQLDELGERPLCFGARRDVWASGMARDMGGGSHAYLLRRGQKPTSADLDGIFEPADASVVGTVREQESERDAWLASVSVSSDGQPSKRSR